MHLLQLTFYDFLEATNIYGPITGTSYRVIALWSCIIYMIVIICWETHTVCVWIESRLGCHIIEVQWFLCISREGMWTLGFTCTQDPFLIYKRTDLTEITWGSNRLVTVLLLVVSSFKLPAPCIICTGSSHWASSKKKNCPSELTSLGLL